MLARLYALSRSWTASIESLNRQALSTVFYSRHPSLASATLTMTSRLSVSYVTFRSEIYTKSNIPHGQDFLKKQYASGQCDIA